MVSSSSVRPRGEPLFDAPRDVAAVSAVRGSVIVLDVARLRDQGLFDRYAAALGEHRALLELGPTEWVPFPLAMEHWHAMDRLALLAEDYRALGRYVGEKAHNVLLSTLMRLAGKVGITPWLALQQSHKVWLRTWVGGGMMVYRSGEHMARLEVLNCSLVQTHSFRAGVCGTIEAGLAPFCRKPGVIERSDERTPTSLVLRASWQP